MTLQGYSLNFISCGGEHVVDKMNDKVVDKMVGLMDGGWVVWFGRRGV